MDTIYTIGHSTRTIKQFIALLKAHNIEELVDVRTIPKSRHNPQFGAEELAASLQQVGTAYKHIAKLGGLQRTGKDSINLGWQNPAFRGFADYMATPEFLAGLDELQAIAEKRTVAIMCAEAVPWRCHRSLIADALTIQDWQVRHIQSRKTASPHELTTFLKVQDGKLMYPEHYEGVLWTSTKVNCSILTTGGFGEPGCTCRAIHSILKLEYSISRFNLKTIDIFQILC